MGDKMNLMLQEFVDESSDVCDSLLFFGGLRVPTDARFHDNLSLTSDLTPSLPPGEHSGSLLSAALSAAVSREQSCPDGAVPSGVKRSHTESTAWNDVERNNDDRQPRRWWWENTSLQPVAQKQRCQVDLDHVSIKRKHSLWDSDVLETQWKRFKLSSPSLFVGDHDESDSGVGGITGRTCDTDASSEETVAVNDDLLNDSRETWADSCYSECDVSSESDSDASACNSGSSNNESDISYGDSDLSDNESGIGGITGRTCNTDATSEETVAVNDDLLNDSRETWADSGYSECDVSSESDSDASACNSCSSNNESDSSDNKSDSSDSDASDIDSSESDSDSISDSVSSDSDSSDSDSDSDSDDEVDTDSDGSSSDDDDDGYDDDEEEEEDLTCPDTCVCQGGSQRQVTPIKRSGHNKVVKPLYVKFLQQLTMSRDNRCAHSCCERYCQDGWTRRTPREVARDYDDSDLSVHHFRWGSWKETDPVCPDTCICKTGQQSLDMERIKRNKKLRVAPQLYKRVLKQRLMRRSNRYRFPCCEQRCNLYRWSRDSVKERGSRGSDREKRISAFADRRARDRGDSGRRRSLGEALCR